MGSCKEGLLIIYYKYNQNKTKYGLNCESK